MTNDNKKKDILHTRAPHEKKLGEQLLTDRELKRHFEKVFSITFTGISPAIGLVIEGDDREVGLAKRGFAHLATLLITDGRLDVQTLYDLAPTLAPERKAHMTPRHNAADRLADRFDAANGNTQKSKKENHGILRHVAPKTKNQANFVDTITRNDVTFGVGPAGTGKTFLAAYMALKALEEGKVERVFLSRPAISNGKDLGALPGDEGQKLAPYMRPLYDELNKLAGKKNVDRMMEAGIIELAPIEFMRGRTFSNAFVIVDEAQNATFEQLKMALTRIGEGSTMVVTGDPRQSDLKGDQIGGFDAVLAKLKGVDSVATQHFDNSDIVRSKVVGNILRALESPAPSEARPTPPSQPKPTR